VTALAGLAGLMLSQLGWAAAALPLGFAPDSGYRLVKDWDFTTVIRDPQALRREFFTRYIYADGSLDHLNDEWSRYRDRDNHVFTPQGLALVARIPSGGAAPGAVESGMLRSRWSGEYGVFEIRMKVPAGRGLFPAFWLNPQDKTWPPEIDIVEIVNNGRDTTRQSFHFLHPDGTGGSTKLAANHTYSPGADYAEGFHVFAVEWTKDHVRHFVDGSLVADRTFRWQHKDGSDGGPAHVLVNLAVGGKWPQAPARDTPFPARLDIEYIRVWQR
jgi:beta-glucanase (GH16 family)